MQNFLGEPSHGVDKIKNILFVFVLFALYLFMYIGAMQWLWENQLFALFSTIVLSPTLEEIIFRVGPMDYVKNQPDKLVPMIIMSSALFGYLHQGPISWPVQGVFGAVLCFVYIKNGYSYWSVVGLHSLWNTYCTFILDKL